jgi:hypothetical protein
MRAMIIDDEDRAQVREIRAILKRCGITVPAHHSIIGNRIVDEFKREVAKIKEPPHLVIVDYELGWKDQEGKKWNGDRIAQYLRTLWSGTAAPYMLCVSNKLVNRQVKDLRSIFEAPPCGLVEFVGEWEVALNAHVDCAADRIGFAPPAQIDASDERLVQVFVARAEAGLRRKIIGRAPDFVRALLHAAKAADTHLPILLSGPAGVGKNLLAQAIHLNSERADAPFETVQFFPNSLMPSDAEVKRKLFHAGTVLFEGVEQVGPKLQAKILELLLSAKAGTARLISSTSLSQSALGKHGWNPEFFKLIGKMPILLPDLRMRQPDIEPMAVHFLDEYNRTENKKVPGLSDKTLRLLRMYSWAGNIDELENVISQAAVLADPGKDVMPRNLPPQVRHGQTGDNPESLNNALRSARRTYLEYLAQRHSGNVTRMAESADVDRASMSRMLTKYGIRPRP